jgi:hypothetical protein
LVLVVDFQSFSKGVAQYFPSELPVPEGPPVWLR